MATGIFSYSTTASDNATASSQINKAEGQSPGSINDGDRQIMADIAEYLQEVGGKNTLAGGTTAYTLTSKTTVPALADGVRIHAVCNAANTGASTLAVDSLGAKKIRKVPFIGATPNDIALEAGDLVIDQHAVFEYDASADGGTGAWILLNPSTVYGRGAPDIILEEQQTSGTAGGTFTSGADRTRVLNTEVRDARGECSLSSNQFTLAAGTYYITWSCPAYRVDQHQAFLYNVTDSAEIKRGRQAYSPNAIAIEGPPAVGSAVFTIAASKALEIRHRNTTTQATNGLGFASSLGTEIYTRVEIWRIS